MTNIAWEARRLPRRSEDGGDDGALDDPVIEASQLLLFSAALVACVVTSPTGWVMSFVWALPIAPLVWTSPGRARLSRRQLGTIGAVWIACAVFPLISGWAAVAGTTLVVALSYAADAWTDGP